jgi:hypothetical protein
VGYCESSPLLKGAIFDMTRHLAYLGATVIPPASERRFIL